MTNLLCIIGLIAAMLQFESVQCKKDAAKLTEQQNHEGDEKSQRKQKLFPIFQIVTFQNGVCTGSTRNGTCFTSAECSNKGGTSSGTCASGYGVCCVFALSCGSTANQNCSYLVQSTTSTAPSTNPCTFSICKCSSNICRIRLDFTTFQIAGPQVGTSSTTAPVSNGGGIGDCVTDSFSLTSPGNTGSPVICGINTGQHMIVDASDSCNLASFDIGSATSTRQWDIKVTQYACGDQNAGPDGCLQYFTGSSGRVSSYNFPTTSSTVGSTATHLSSQCYTMCFRQELGKCSICFTTSITNLVVPNTPADTQTSFGLSISSAAITATSLINTNCIADYLIIPDAALTPAASPTSTTERICGRVFDAASGTTATGHSVCSSVIPFQIQFKSDSNELSTGSTDATTNEQAQVPGGIVGFSLNYVEQAC